MPVAAFVAPFLARATLRFVEAAVALPDVRVAIITQEPVEKLPPSLREGLAGHWRVDDALDARQLVAAGRGLAQQLGGLDAMLGILEQAQEAMAEARAVLGLPGIDAATARSFRDKNRMKDVLRAAGVPCARHALVGTAAAARRFATEVGFPIVVKPPAGAGAKSTFRVEDEAALLRSLAVTGASDASPMLLEEFMTGREYSFDSVMIDGRLAWHSFSHYLPSPLEVLETPWIQWQVLLPREIDGQAYASVRDTCEQALRALGLRTGMTHMEWFLRPDGTIAISEVAARPPGAQFTSLISYAHDVDFYRVWSRFMITGEFSPPARRYAAGGAYLRGQGSGRVARIRGLEEAQRELGPLVVEASLPKEGQPRSDGYEGDGYAILRHEETEVVRRGLARLVELVQVEVSP